MASRILGPYRGRPFRTLVATAKILAAGHLGFTYFYSWSPVSGPSMLPFWEIWGNGAIVAHQYRRGRGIEVGDLVSFKVPTSNNPAIKRVAGLSGDYVLVHSPDKGRDEMIQVPKGHCWLLGDNLSASRDSRLYGPVPLALVDGKVIYKTGEWPWELTKIVNPLNEREA